MQLLNISHNPFDTFDLSKQCSANNCVNNKTKSNVGDKKKYLHKMKISACTFECTQVLPKPVINLCVLKITIKE